MSVRDEAARFGIDLALLDANLAQTPAERLSELTAMIRLAEELQDRTLPVAAATRRDAGGGPGVRVRRRPCPL